MFQKNNSRSPSTSRTFFLSTFALMCVLGSFAVPRTAAAAPNGSSFISQTPPPSTMTVGQTATVSVTMQNTGTNTWVQGGSNPYRLGSQNPQDNLNWGLNRINLPVATVAPGAQVTFTFTVTAPSTPGTYNFQWKMEQEVNKWFGALSTNVAVAAIDTIPPAVSLTAPAGGSTISGVAVAVSANASDNIAVAGVQFKDGTTNIGAEDTTSPYSASWNTTAVANGSHTLTAVARDTSNNTTTSASVTVTVNNPPIVSLTANPASVSTGSASTLTWSSTNAASCSASASPSNSNWSGSKAVSGSQSTGVLTQTTIFTLTCDGTGGSDSSSATVSVSDFTAPSTPTGLDATAVSSSQINLSWTASTDNVAVTGYRVYRDGTQIDTVTATSYSDAGLSPLTAYSYSVQAFDAAGNASAQSSPASATTAAPPPPNVSGWAWGGTNTTSADMLDSFVGWISFSTTVPPIYGVSEDYAGALSGYAWSSNLGWITFNSAEVSGCPSAPCAPSVNLSTGELTGWARACSAFASGCSGALDGNSGGWDGWIALSGTAGDGTSYGVTQDLATCAWSGFAWGSDGIGAIDMGGSYGVVCTPVTQPDLTAGSVSTIPATSPISATAGTATTFSATISNIGTGTTGAGFTNLFQRANDVLGNGATDIGTSAQSTALSGGATATASFSYTFATAGTFYMRVCADKSSAGDAGTITEPQPFPNGEFNNCGEWTAVTVALSELAGTFSASPDTIDPGQPSTLTWTSNATSCNEVPGTIGFSTGGAANGSSVPPVTPTNPGQNGYQIRCTKLGYTDLLLSTTVTVISATATISARPTCISGGGSSKISWSVLPVSQIQPGSCRLSGPGLSSNPLTVSPDGSAPNASPQTAIVNIKSTYTISCITTGGATVTKSVVVDVSGCWTEF